MPLMHDTFEWDDDKNAANQRKHGVDFETAQAVLSDPQGDLFHVDVSQNHAGEWRWKTYASDPAWRQAVYVIAWTERANTRIISARAATPKEKRFYEKEITRRQS